MRVKLDENLPIQLKRLFAESGQGAATERRLRVALASSTRTCQAKAHGAA